MAEPVTYFILQTLWSNALGRDLHIGEHATLDDLSPEQIDKLSAGNVILLDVAKAPSGPTADSAPAVRKPAATKGKI